MLQVTSNALRQQVVNNEGKIIFKQMGPLTEKILDDEISKLF